MRRLLLACLLWSSFALLAAAAAAQESTSAGAACTRDLEDLAPYMLANDAGARDEVARKGQAVFDAALATARAQAANAGTDEACLVALRKYLQTFRESHLGLRAIGVPGAATPSQPPLPSFRLLSARTALLTVPSFADQAGDALAALVNAHAQDIARRPNLLIDVRGNGGGSDWTYEPLLPLLDANARRLVGAQLLATPANSAANRAMCDLFAPTSAQCREVALSTSEAMDRAVPGTFIATPGERDVEIVRPRQVAHMPRRVGVLVDKGCGSTCEEFLLAARQSFKVKLFGQSSAGSLDYSNLRPYTLPSGKRRLLYATSRSLRLPAFAVDVAGIPPDQVLPAPTDAAGRDRELIEVQEVLESAR